MKRILVIAIEIAALVLGAALFWLLYVITPP